MNINIHLHINSIFEAIGYLVVGGVALCILINFIAMLRLWIIFRRR